MNPELFKTGTENYGKVPWIWTLLIISIELFKFTNNSVNLPFVNPQ